MPMTTDLDERVAAVRAFNRFYTSAIGALREGLHESQFSLTEARVLFELAHRDRPTATDIGRELGLDAGYLSRILRGFRRQRLIARTPAPHDRRAQCLMLTAAGRNAFAPLDDAARAEIEALLTPLDDPGRRRLLGAMQAIENLLARPARTADAFRLRPPSPGDMGWVTARHGALYAAEYGFDTRFEGLVAGIVAAFVADFDAKRERCWIAEQDGQPVGSAFLVKGEGGGAKLRLLLVEPAARGLGIGQALVAECIDFARAGGYQRLTLWTQSILLAARRIYDAAGFRLISSEPHHSFGCDLVGEHWELTL
jgi:DNA-binding MarR family transcriptional regulator/N-acetylglutamate synthase-like GNAT family acetyltransferase